MRISELKTYRMALFVLITPLLLTACTKGVSNARKSTSLVLPHVIQYDGGLLDQAASEIEGASCPALTEFAKDYKLTRDRIRVAQKELL